MISFHFDIFFTFKMWLACYRCASNGRNYPYFQTLKILHIYSEYEVVLEKRGKN